MISMRLLRVAALLRARMAHSAIAPRLLAVLTVLALASAGGAQAQDRHDAILEWQ